MMRRWSATITQIAVILTASATIAVSSAGNPANLDKVHATRGAFVVPDVQLVRDDGRAVSFPGELDDGRPVFLNFIFTSCPGICPLMSESFRQLQSRLGSERARVHMVSVSIDPEEDTPARLRQYASRFRADSQWQHYTGTVQSSLAVQRAFGVYNGDKMAHTPITFFRASPRQSWVQLKGFATGNDLMSVYKSGGSVIAVAR